MAVEEAAESCGSHAAAGGGGAGGAASGPAASSSSAGAAAQARKQQLQQRHKLEVYTEVLRRLHDSGMPEARAPGFDDELWSHFNRLPARYVLGPSQPCQSDRGVVFSAGLAVWSDLDLPGIWSLQLRHGCERGAGGGRAHAQAAARAGKGSGAAAGFLRAGRSGDSFGTQF
jgi:hypothetical protein